MERLLDLLERREREQAFAGRQDVAETGFLRDHRPAARQVSRAAIAEPVAAQPDVLVLRHREFPFRLPDELTTRRHRSTTQRVRTAVQHVGREHLAAAAEAVEQGTLAGGGGAGGGVVEELEVLAPAIHLPVQRDGPPRLAPVADGREGIRRSASKEFPEVDHDRLPGGDEHEWVAGRHAAIGIAVVLAPREKRAMGFEVVNRVPYLMDLDLVCDRIGADVDQSAGFAVLAAERLAVQVEDDGGVAVADWCAREPVFRVVV